MSKLNTCTVGKPWTPRTPEDILLEQYWRTCGGRLYVEVPIGGPGGRGAWPTGCTIRRLDGVRLLSDSSAPPAVTWYADGAKAFATDLQNLAAEIIEVKLSLNRGAIGQAIAGRRMFQRQYDATPKRTIVLCRTADSALAWVCAQENIDVEVYAQAPNNALQPDGVSVIRPALRGNARR